jgi:hypothetical protein
MIGTWKRPRWLTVTATLTVTLQLSITETAMMDSSWCVILRSRKMISVDLHWHGVEGKQFGLVDMEFWANKIDKAPRIVGKGCFKRGSSHQERFTLGAARFCGSVSEAGPARVLRKAWYQVPSSSLINAVFVPAHETSGSKYSDQLEPYRLWGRLVEIFCPSKLTKESDKMVAISGIAIKFRSEIMCEFSVQL